MYTVKRRVSPMDGCRRGVLVIVCTFYGDEAETHPPDCSRVGDGLHTELAKSGTRNLQGQKAAHQDPGDEIEDASRRPSEHRKS